MRREPGLVSRGESDPRAGQTVGMAWHDPVMLTWRLTQGELAEGVGADGFLGEPGEDGEAGGVFRFHFVDVGLFAVGASE